jgi:hypothetical protein
MAEPMAWPPRDDDALGLALTDLARAVAFPETPPMASMVASRLRGETVRRPTPARAWLAGWLGRPLARSIGLALLALLVLAGAAVAFGLVIGGLRITLAPRTQLPLPSGVVQSRAFGTEMGLADARRRAGFTVLVPTLAAIGQPDHVYLNPIPSGGTVFLVWGSRAGYPAGADGVGVVVSEFRANVDPGLWEKMVHEDSTIIRTQVGVHDALWISGGEHTFFYRDANGLVVDSSLRLVGTALIWQQDGLVLRVEGAPDLASATDVADSLR